MVNLEAQVTGLSSVNEAARAEGVKMKQFLGTIEPSIVVQATRIKAVQEIQKQAKLIADEAIRKLDASSAKTGSALRSTIKDMEAQCGVIKSKVNALIGHIETLEQSEKDYKAIAKSVKDFKGEKPADKPARKKSITERLDQLMKRTKRAFSEGQAGMDTLDAARKTLTEQSAAADKLIARLFVGREQAVAASRKLTDGSEQETKKAYDKAKTYLDDDFIRQCWDHNKELMAELAKG